MAIKACLWNAVSAAEACLTWLMKAQAGLLTVLVCHSVRVLGGHRQRVGALSWGSHLLSTGSRDRHILHHDIRAPEDFVHRLSGHRSEVAASQSPLHAPSQGLIGLGCN